jgi:HSP20 family protein
VENIMAENEQGQSTQRTQTQSGDAGRQQGQQGQGQNPYNIQQQRGAGSRDMARRGLFGPSFFSMSPFAFLATSPFELIRQFTEELEQLSGQTKGGSSTSMQPTTAGSMQNRPGAVLGQGFFAPQIDVIERDGQLVIRADLPGVNRDDVRVEMTDDALIIEGERRYEHEENQGGVYRAERDYGVFRRVIPLPEGVSAENATATFRNGVLEIAMPMPQARSRSRQLEIKDAGQSGDNVQAQGATAGSKS